MASSKAAINLQDIFLNQVRKEHVPVTVYLINGFQLKGTVKGFDNFTVVLESESKQQLLIYKHAISTISPQKPVIFSGSEKDDKKEGVRSKKTVLGLTNTVFLK